MSEMTLTEFVKWVRAWDGSASLHLTVTPDVVTMRAMIRPEGRSVDQVSTQHRLATSQVEKYTGQNLVEVALDMMCSKLDGELEANNPHNL